MHSLNLVKIFKFRLATTRLIENRIDIKSLRALVNICAFPAFA
jgi:hypothetical protein